MGEQISSVTSYEETNLERYSFSYKETDVSTIHFGNDANEPRHFITILLVLVGQSNPDTSSGRRLIGRYRRP